MAYARIDSTCDDSRINLYRKLCARTFVAQSRRIFFTLLDATYCSTLVCSAMLIFYFETKVPQYTATLINKYEMMKGIDGHYNVAKMKSRRSSRQQLLCIYDWNEL